MQFGEALAEVHDDPRGILFFPDSVEPDASTYAGVIAEVAEEGVWISLAAEVVPAASSFEIATMFEGIHCQLVETLGRFEALHAAAPTEGVEPPPSSGLGPGEKKAK